jgi:WD40 repeat protein
VAVILSGTSCGVRPAEPGGTAIAAGVSLTSCDLGSSVHNIAWSPDGAEIFYLTYDGGDALNNVAFSVAVKAARADRRETRIVEGFAPQHYYLGLAAPPDASAIYTDVLDDTSGRVISTLVDVLGKNRIGEVANATALAASGDDRHVVSTDITTSIFDISTRAVVESDASLGRDARPGIAFSPAGDQFFLAAPSAGVGLTLDTMGNLLARPAVPWQEGGLASPSWNADGIRILLADTSGAFRILNVTTGATTMLGAPVADGGFVSACAAWSRDGTKVFFWNKLCSDGGPSCIYVADAETGVATFVISAEGFFAGDLAVSPDGKRLAYTSVSGLYVVDLP